MGLAFERGKFDFDLVLTDMFSEKLQDNLDRPLHTYAYLSPLPL